MRVSLLGNNNTHVLWGLYYELSNMWQKYNRWSFGDFIPSWFFYTNFCITWMLFSIKSAVIRRIRGYFLSIVCTHELRFRKHLGFRVPPQVFDEIILLRFIAHNTFHFYARGKEAKRWFYIKYSMHTHVLVLLIKGCQFFRNCVFDVNH